jgi:hypothetical protein
VESRDVTRSVRRTWDICIGRTLRRMAVDPGFARRFAALNPEGRAFFPAIFRIQTAYATRTMRYVVVSARKE